MKKTHYSHLLLGGLLLAGLVGQAAWAVSKVSKGGTLYVRTDGTPVKSDPTSTITVAKLSARQPVKWLGADPKDKRWHMVEATTGKHTTLKGVVYAGNLTPELPPARLIAFSSAGINLIEVASGAAGVRALGGETAESKGERVSASDANLQLSALSNTAKKVTAEDVAGYLKQNGLGGQQ